MNTSDRRAAFTLIEVLVVLAIIGILIGLLVPAVQNTRNAVARVECSNNLKQIGLASHQFHDAYKAFPPGTRFQGGQDSFPRMTWLAQLLPYLEQDNLWKLTLDAYAKQRPGPPGYSPGVAHDVPFATVVTTFSCPGDGRALTPTTILPKGNGVVLQMAMTNYLGNQGTNWTTKDGVLYTDSRVRLLDIRDGSSSTFLAGERPPFDGSVQGGWYTGFDDDAPGTTYVTLGAEELNFRIAPPCPSGPYWFVHGRINDPCDAFHFWSLHAGGANFVFCDGSVRFVFYSAAPILRELATRNGGEVVQGPN